MIYIRLSGRFGNYLFQIAAGASLAKKYNTGFKVVVAPDSEAIATTSDESMWNYVASFKENIFKGIDFIRQAPEGIPSYSWRDFPYKPIPYEKDTDLLIDGYFQSYKYLDTDYVRELYAPPTAILESLKRKYGHILEQKPVCVHVRRGDYLHIPHRFSICSASYFRRAMASMGSESVFLVISDDIDWCKKHLNGVNIHFAESGNSMLEDFYLQSLSAHNIISNSSFSWWGAWLNSNPDKKIVYPTPWFGPHYSHLNTDDLCPDSWTPVFNKTPFRYRMKANCIRLRMKIERILSSKNK